MNVTYVRKPKTTQFPMILHLQTKVMYQVQAEKNNLIAIGLSDFNPPSAGKKRLIMYSLLLVFFTYLVTQHIYLLKNYQTTLF